MSPKLQHRLKLDMTTVLCQLNTLFLFLLPHVPVGITVGPNAIIIFRLTQGTATAPFLAADILILRNRCTQYEVQLLFLCKNREQSPLTLAQFYARIRAFVASSVQYSCYTVGSATGVSTLFPCTEKTMCISEILNKINNFKFTQ